MEIYIDRIFNAFAFRLVPPGNASVRGSVLDATGSHLVGAEVILTENGNSHRTFTNSKGEHTFYGSISGPATVTAAGATKLVQLPSKAALNLEIRAP